MVDKITNTTTIGEQQKQDLNKLKEMLSNRNIQHT